jgi:hypothetical protein
MWRVRGGESRYENTEDKVEESTRSIYLPDYTASRGRRRQYSQHASGIVSYEVCRWVRRA